MGRVCQSTFRYLSLVDDSTVVDSGTESNPKSKKYLTASRYAEEMELYAVIDTKDKVVIFTGSLEECEEVQDTQYGGLAVFAWEDLTDEEKDSWKEPEPRNRIISTRGY